MATETTIKFTAEFLDQRMEAHKRWAHDVQRALVEEIIDEVQELPRRKPKSGTLFPELPAHLVEARQ